MNIVFDMDEDFADAAPKTIKRGNEFFFSSSSFHNSHKNKF